MGFSRFGPDLYPPSSPRKLSCRHQKPVAANTMICTPCHVTVAHTHTHTHTHTRTRTRGRARAHARAHAYNWCRVRPPRTSCSLPSAAVASTPVPFAHTPAACISCRRHHYLSSLRSLSEAWQPQGRIGQGGNRRRQFVQADDEELRQVSALAWAATVLCSGVPRSRSRPRTPHRVAVCCCTVHLLLALAQRCACEVIPCWAAACLVYSVRPAVVIKCSLMP